jgi:Coenzyme PQQ synthesis protein D (PqqD)
MPRRWTTSDVGRLGPLAAALERFGATCRFVDYGQAEQDCEALAALLRDRFSRRELARFSVLPIPRGGLIVAGMLAYLLDLAPEQLAVGRRPRSPVLVVDDCALTGARFAAALGGLSAAEVVFAHLYSHPALRRAVLRREPRVTACLAAHDLRDPARDSFPRNADYQAWRRRWRRRLGPDRYWFGQPELIAFAWSEPDRPFWNPVTKRVEDGWRLLPPHRCLKNRARLGPPRPATAARTWQVPAAVAYGEFDGVLWLCQTEKKETYGLEGTGADVWRSLARWGDSDLAAASLRSEYEVDEATARSDIEAFAVELEAQGLLERLSGRDDAAERQA